VASGCPGCQLQLGLGVKRRGLTMQVLHPVQLLAEAYRNEKKSPEELKAQPEEEVVVAGH